MTPQPTPESVPAAVTSASPDARAGTAAVAIAEILREGLRAGSERADLDSILETVATRLGYEAVAIGRGSGQYLDLIAAHGFSFEGGPGGQRIHQNEGITGEAYRTGRVVSVEDTRMHPRWLDASGGAHRSAVAVPMRLPDRVWGVLAVEASTPRAFDDDDLAALTPLADQMAWALETLWLRREADERAAREERLRRGLEATAAVITAGLADTRSENVVDRMVREIHAQLQWESLAVLLLEDDGIMRVAGYYGYSPEVANLKFSVERGILGHVAVTGRPYLAPETATDPYFSDEAEGTRSEMCVPLVVSGRVRGVVNVESRTPGRFDAEDLDILARIADQMTLVLHNAELLSAEKDTVARLHELDRLKSRLLTMASHELRTPLTVVMGFAEVLAEHAPRLDPSKLHEYSGAIARQASLLKRLVDQMLIAAQMEQGQLTVTRSVADLGNVVAAAREGRERVEVLDGVAGCRVLADPFRLRQVFENLFDNAIKYAGRGRIQVAARRSGETVTVLLRDEGPGIPGVEHEKVFETFHQVGEHGVAGRRGLGLGLAVARDLVRLMGGDLSVASAEGYGATFSLTLPAAH